MTYLFPDIDIEFSRHANAISSAADLEAAQEAYWLCRGWLDGAFEAGFMSAETCACNLASIDYALGVKSQGYGGE